MMNRAHASSVRWFDQPMNYREPASDAREATEVPQAVPAHAMSAAASRQELAGAYAEYGRYIFRVLRRLGVPDAALDDAVQDVFVVAWRRHEAFEQRSSTRTWLYGIARRVARDHRRARQRTARHDPEVDTISGGSSPEADTESARAARRVDAVLAQMSDVLREVFVLAEIEQLPVTEIAEIVQAPLNTTYSRLRLARAKFSELVHAEGGTR